MGIEMITQTNISVIKDPDARLMVRVGQGDFAAFDELMSRYQKRVHGLVIQMMGNDVEAEDLVQQVFLRVFSARNTYVPSAQFVTWLFKITRNVALTARHSRARRKNSSWSQQHPLSKDRAQYDQVTSEAGPSEFAERTELLNQLHSAMNRLSEREQNALKLVYFEGKNAHTAATQLGTSAIAVKSLVSRARNKLRNTLRPSA